MVTVHIQIWGDNWCYISGTLFSRNVLQTSELVEANMLSRDIVLVRQTVVGLGHFTIIAKIIQMEKILLHADFYELFSIGHFGRVVKASAC